MLTDGDMVLKQGVSRVLPGEGGHYSFRLPEGAEFLAYSSHGILSRWRQERIPRSRIETQIWEASTNRTRRREREVQLPEGWQWKCRHRGVPGQREAERPGKASPLEMGGGRSDDNFHQSRPNGGVGNRGQLGVGRKGNEDTM